jgi:hypothetical protein
MRCVSRVLVGGLLLSALADAFQPGRAWPARGRSSVPRAYAPFASTQGSVPGLARRPWKRARGTSALRGQAQKDDGQQGSIEGGRQGSVTPWGTEKGPDPLAPYCTETEAIFTGELYPSKDGTKVLELPDGSTILERRDGVQVTKVMCSGFYCIDVEMFQQPGTESNLNTLITTIKVIVGGVAPLLMPWCIKNQGIVGGPLTVLGVGLLSQYTVKQLVEYRDAVVVETGRDDLTYVDVARHAFGDTVANGVFLMTIVNSLGVCAAYSSFIGSTLATLSSM